VGVADLVVDLFVLESGAEPLVGEHVQELEES
jgi:hypothetical protein